MQKNADDRKTILARIRKALKTPAPRPNAHHAGLPTQSTPDGTNPNDVNESGEIHAPNSAEANISDVAPSTPVFKNQLPIVSNKEIADFQQWLPQIGKSREEQVALFAANCAELTTEFFLCDDEEDLKTQLQKLKEECDWARVASHQGMLSGVLQTLGLPILLTDDGYDVLELEQCDVAITECDALIAQTGSTVVTSRSTGGRALSVLPGHHVVVARREQMLPDLSAAFALIEEKYGGNYPSMIGFITGPSRTGDIERILVLGAHGPKRLTIFCL